MYTACLKVCQHLEFLLYYAVFVFSRYVDDFDRPKRRSFVLRSPWICLFAFCAPGAAKAKVNQTEDNIIEVSAAI